MRVGRPNILEKPITVHIRLDGAVKERLEQNAQDVGGTLSGLIRKILREHLDAKAPKKKLHL